MVSDSKTFGVRICRTHPLKLGIENCWISWKSQPKWRCLLVIHPTEMVMKYGDLMGYHGIKHWNVTGDIHRQDFSDSQKWNPHDDESHILCWQRHHSGVESLPRGQIPKRLLVALVYPFCCLVQCLVLLSAVGEISTMFKAVFRLLIKSI